MVFCTTDLVAKCIHFTLLWTIPPTKKTKVHTFGGLMNSATKTRNLPNMFLAYLLRRVE